MCQILAGKASDVIPTLLNTKGLLDSLYNRNSDGIGAMYASTKHGLRTPRTVPKNVRQARAFLQSLPQDERNIVVHFRLGTSGYIDRANAHPFTVLDGELAMTHNGVLYIDTATDESKCDTRHYIDAIIRPCVTDCRELFKNQAWLALLGSDIGENNRFVFMDKHGEMSFVNRDTGYEVGDIWIANTYSFNAGLLIPDWNPPVRRGSYYPANRHNDDLYNRNDWMDSDWPSSYRSHQPARPVAQVGIKPVTSSAPVVPITDDEMADKVWDAIREADVPALTEMLVARPAGVLRKLFDDWEFVSTVDPDTGMSKPDGELVKRLQAGSMRSLVDYVWNGGRSAATKLSEVICWYGSWYPTEDDEPAATAVPEGSDAHAV